MSANIAIIGTGRMGRGLFKTLYKAYPDKVVLAGRDIVNTQSVIDEMQINCTAVTIDEALKAQIIIPTLWFKDLKPWLSSRQNVLKGKILVDIVNAFNESFDNFTIPYGTSATEEIQKLLPETIVTGAFKNTYWVVFDNPELQGIKSDVFVTANDDTVRAQLMELLRPLPFRILDAGPIVNNRTIERMTLLSSYMGKKAGSYPLIAYNLWGLPH